MKHFTPAHVVDLTQPPPLLRAGWPTTQPARLSPRTDSRRLKDLVRGALHLTVGRRHTLPEPRETNLSLAYGTPATLARTLQGAIASIAQYGRHDTSLGDVELEGLLARTEYAQQLAEHLEQMVGGRGR